MISGERAMDHRVMTVRCSSRVKRVERRPRSSMPNGSMSASGQCPGPPNSAHLRNRSNCSFSAGQLSQKSSLMRHRLACRLTCSAAASAVSPGERLSTIGRPVRSMAFRTASISAWWSEYGRLMSSTLTKSTPHAARSPKTES